MSGEGSSQSEGIEYAPSRWLNLSFTTRDLAIKLLLGRGAAKTRFFAVLERILRRFRLAFGGVFSGQLRVNWRRFRRRIRGVFGSLSASPTGSSLAHNVPPRSLAKSCGSGPYTGRPLLLPDGHFAFRERGLRSRE